MSLAWATGSSTLAQWGFSAGDIAAIAGAGRSVGTWLMAQSKDRMLLDFLQTEAHDVIKRRGLIDRVALHERWDTRLFLLQNGRRRIIETAGGKTVENMDKFTWLMTLFVASLDAAFSVSNVRKVMTEFLTMLFSEHVDGLDYLLHELPRHVEGWMSIAITRNIAARARAEWFTLANRGVHEPGLIPTGDVGEIVRLLNWITTSREQKFFTSSGDAYALSIVMHAIGIDLLSTGGAASEQDESRLVVCLVTDPISTSTKGQFQRLNERTGMRVPLQCMEECVSVWPGTPAENNERRGVFNDGARAAEGLVLEMGRPYRERDGALVLWYQVDGHREDSNRRIDTLVHRLAKELFPVTTPGVETCLRSIAEDLKEAGLLEGLKGDFGPIVQHIARNPAILVRLQTFVMGYYYNLLHRLVNISQLSIPQALGSWAWSDIRMITQIGNILSTCRINVIAPHWQGGRNFYKHGIMRLLAMFFAGAEEEQINLIVSGVVGVHGKLSLLNASLFGDIDTISKAGTFFLMDVDPTCIPSTSRGIVTSSQRRVRVEQSVIDSSGIEICQIDDRGRHDFDDLTSHIEPDWDYDIQMTTVVFRYLGRFVRRVSPTDCEYAISEDALNLPSWFVDRKAVDVLANENLDRVRDPWSHNYTSGFIPGPIPRKEGFGELGPPTLISTGGREKFRTCLRAWYWSNGFHALPFGTPYFSMIGFGGCQVLCARDDKEYDLDTAFELKTGSEELHRMINSNRSLRAVGRYVIII